MNKLDGKSLERAVSLIETHILNHISKHEIGKISVETNKILISDGVRSEIDIFVNVDLKTGTNLVYIFECKNWKKTSKVSKNDIIIFSNKIEISNAQKGYFIAREYTKDSNNQAKKNDRIELLKLDSDNSRIFDKDYFIQIESSYVDNTQIECQFTSQPLFNQTDIGKLIIQSENIKMQSVGNYLREIISKGETEYKKQTEGDNKKLRISNSEKLTTLHLSQDKWSFHLEIFKPTVNKQNFDGIRFKVSVDYLRERPAIMFEYNVEDKGHYAKLKLRGLFKNDYSTMEITKNTNDNSIQVHNLEIE